MSDTAAYDDYEDLTPSPGVIDKPTAQGFLAQHRARGEKAGAQFDDVMKQRAAAVAAAREQLDQTIAEMRQKHSGGGLGAINLPMLSLAAGLLSPSPNGNVSNFGQELGRGLSSMGTTIRAQRMSDSDFLRGIAQLQAKSAEMGDAPLKDAALIAGRQQAASEGAAAGIERALIKANGEGTSPARVKEFNEWVKDPQHAGKSYAEFLKWRADELGADKTPALLREFAEWKKAPGNENRPISDFYGEKERLKTSAHEVGKSQGQATQALPAMDSTIEQMTTTLDSLKKHPGLTKAVGLLSPLPNIPGGDAADFTAQLEQLKGQAFLLQFEKLRGAGAITDVEGKKATDALAALSTSQSEKQFRKQLDIVDGVLKKGREVVAKKAGIAPAGNIPKVMTKDVYDKLPSGAQFEAPDGSVRTKP